MESPPMFNSVEDECRYWKERAKLYHKEWTDVKQEYDEYVEQSRQMEAEMDATLEQKQGIIKDLRMKLSSLEKENESLKLKLESHSIELTNVEKQLESMKTERDSTKEYLRQLEQKNDDLERAHRILNESIVDFERMLDKAYEKNALLEMEVDEKEMLQEKLQRLMDETRDLKQELNVKSRYQPNGSVANNTLNTNASLTIPNGVANNGDIAHDMISSPVVTNSVNNSTTNIHDYNQHSLKRKPFVDPDNLLNGNAITASSRTTALNIVADMLRKLNLDKALLCPQCDRFRCICERPISMCEPSTPSQPANNMSRLKRSLTNTFGSSNSINTTASTTMTCNNTPTDDATAPDATGVTMRRSNSSLNFGTNIFKRFAERMSGNIKIQNSTSPTDTTTAVTNSSAAINTPVTTPTFGDTRNVSSD